MSPSTMRKQRAAPGRISRGIHRRTQSSGRQTLPQDGSLTVHRSTARVSLHDPPQGQVHGLNPVGNHVWLRRAPPMRRCCISRRDWSLIAAGSGPSF
jgi:hypothetical protein